MKIQFMLTIRKPPAIEKPPDPFAPIAESRARDRAESLKMRMQLDKLRLERQRDIQASRAKFNAARWKMINKSMDD